MRGQIRIRSAPYPNVYSSQKLKSKILHNAHPLIVLCRRTSPCSVVMSLLTSLTNWLTFESIKIRGQIKIWSDPWKAKFWFKVHFIALCRRNYFSGQPCLLWEHCRQANDGFSCNWIVCICTGETLPNGEFLLYGGNDAVDFWLIFGEHWRGEQCLKLLLDPYFGSLLRLRIDWHNSRFLQDRNFGCRDCRGLESVTMRAGTGEEEG